MTVCRACGESKDSGEFYAKDPDCKPCRREAKRLWYAEHKATHRVKVVAARYQMTPEVYVAALSRGCDICGSSENVGIDHSHSCCPQKAQSCGRCVRGVLCHRCNTAIGLFREDLKSMKNALVYVKGGE